MSSKIKDLPHKEFSSKRFKTVRTPYFFIKIKKNESFFGRVGVVAGKSAGKTAVERNFLKRQARGVLSKNLTAGNDVLVVFLRGASDVAKKEIRQELINATQKAQK